MTRWEERITVDAPTDKVYEYVSDFTRHGEWSGHGLTATKTTEGPVSIGTTFATVAKQFGTQRETSTIVEIAPAARFAWESAGALGRVRHWFATSDAQGSTELVKGAEFVHPKFLARLMMFRINKDLPASLRADLANIKRAMEGSAG